jgi:hypothetical protein
VIGIGVPGKAAAHEKRFSRRQVHIVQPFPVPVRPVPVNDSLTQPGHFFLRRYVSAVSGCNIPAGTGRAMHRDVAPERIPATINELQARVAAAFGRHPLCRDVCFDVVSTPRTSNGANWTVSIRVIPPDAIWEASELVADIQNAYILAA